MRLPETNQVRVPEMESHARQQSGVSASLRNETKRGFPQNQPMMLPWEWASEKVGEAL
jgi:hypothetical protein